MTVIRCFFCRRRGPLEFVYMESVESRVVCVCTKCDDRFADARICFHVVPMPSIAFALPEGLTSKDKVTIRIVNKGRPTTLAQALEEMGLTQKKRSNLN